MRRLNQPRQVHNRSRAGKKIDQIGAADVRPRPLDAVDVESTRPPSHAHDTLHPRIGAQRLHDARADVTRRSDDNDLHPAAISASDSTPLQRPRFAPSSLINRADAQES